MTHVTHITGPKSKLEHDSQVRWVTGKAITLTVPGGLACGHTWAAKSALLITAAESLITPGMASTKLRP